MKPTSSSLFLSASALRVASQVWRPALSIGEARSITGISMRGDAATCTWRRTLIALQGALLYFELVKSISI